MEDIVNEVKYLVDNEIKEVISNWSKHYRLWYRYIWRV